MNRLYLDFKHKQVRALVWILHSPSLLNVDKALDKPFSIIDQTWGEQVFQKHLNWFKELDENPKELEVWLDKYRSYRLGIRFEKLIIFLFNYLQSQGEISHFTSNLPIYDENKRTLGELDLLFFDPVNDRRVHWEIATKYYLFRPEEFNHHRWLGANGSDWLQRKVDHLFTRQLGITNSIEAKMAMTSYFGDELSKKELSRFTMVKGRLFHPLNHEPKLNDEEKGLLNFDVLNGWWTYPEFFYQADTQQIGKWLILDKLDWIVPQFYSYNDDDLLSVKEMSMVIKRHFSQSKRSLHLAYFSLDEESQLWIEDGRGFVVDPLWPNYIKNTN